MGTSAILCKRINDGCYKCITVHWDGDKLLPLLKFRYRYNYHVDELLELGDASYLTGRLHPTPGIPHVFDFPEKDVSVFYNRDRGDRKEDCGPWFLTIDEIKATDHDYIYVFDGEWKVIRGEAS